MRYCGLAVFILGWRFHSHYTLGPSNWCWDCIIPIQGVPIWATRNVHWFRCGFSYSNKVVCFAIDRSMCFLSWTHLNIGIGFSNLWGSGCSLIVIASTTHSLHWFLTNFPLTSFIILQDILCSVPLFTSLLTYFASSLSVMYLSGE